jgi:outer membrane protein OmpA-like peptidoglycan-associated protein
MRFIINGLSILFFTLSAVITFKALGLPVHETSYQDNRKDAMPESDIAIKKLIEEQNTNRAIVADLQGKIAELEDKLKTKEDVPEINKTTDAEISPQTLVIFGGWTFRPGKVAINDVALSTIDNIIGDIRAAKDSRVIIEGHADNIPTGKPRGDNMDLSLRRAKAIANALASRGISRDRISVIGYGDARPIESNDTEEGRAKNRRVEVKLMPKEGID